ncbi:hypothetical protein [Actinophytocola sp. KF-1]
MAVNSLVDVIHNHFGEKLSDKLADRLKGRPTPRVEHLHAAYAEFHLSGVQDKPEAHVRPYVYMPAADNGMLIGPKPPGTLKPSEFRHLLLYCHSVGFEDRLGHALWREITGSNAPYLVSVGDVLGYYSSYAKLLAENVMVPLVFDLEERFTRRGGPALADSSVFLSKADEVVERMHRKHSRFPWDTASNAISDVEDALLAAHRYGTLSDMWFPSDTHIRFFREYLRLTGAKTVATGRDMRTFTRLHRWKLPSIHQLADRDIIAIRANEEAFASWRSSLSSAIATYEEVEQDGIGDPGRAFRHRLAADLAALNKSAKEKSAIFARVSKSFTFGAIGAAAAGGVFGWDRLAPAVTTGIGSAVADIGSDLAASRKSRRANRALKNHFVVAIDPGGKSSAPGHGGL